MMTSVPQEQADGHVELPLGHDNRDLVRERFGASAAHYATSSVHAKGWSLQRMVELTRPRDDWRVLDIATDTWHIGSAATAAGGPKPAGHPTCGKPLPVVARQSG